jgi:alpha-tubulin suppressor-like RCC1 family protein
MGYNAFGQLGDGSTNNINQPEMIVTSNVIAVAAGMYHSLFLKDDGSAWAIGDDNAGQLGDGTHVNFTNWPVMIMSSGATNLAAGNQSTHSLIVKGDGSIWATGLNNSGQLGVGNNSNTNRPTKMILIPNYKLTAQAPTNGVVQLAFFGFPGTNYALERTTSLIPANWIPQLTNLANSYWPVSMTNVPDPTTNNFWRVRALP